VSDFRNALASGGRIIFDGAMGTALQTRGLAPGRNPEEFCMERPDILRSVHADYVRAGADVLTTNTFGGTRYKLPSALPVADFNRRMAEEARRAVAESGAERRIFIAGSIGPTGKFLRPLGDVSFDAMVAAFREQIRGLMEGGVDLLIAETHFDLGEVRAAAVAARREGRLPLALSMTYESGRTLTGSSVEVCAATLANLGADLIAMNCSAGPEEMRSAALDLLRFSPAPVLIQPNAGLPQLRDGETVFPLGPEDFARLTAEFAHPDRNGGAQCLGGCCGTGPAHIAALKNALAGLPAPGARPARNGAAFTSRSRIVRIGAGLPLRIIGERINPTGKKQLAAELRAGEFSTALRLADEQAQSGAALLDVNVGAPMTDELRCLPALVSRLQTRVALPLSLDSSNMDALEKALEEYPASALINSISGEEGRLERMGPLCRDFGAPFILLPLRGGKLPVKAAQRIAVLENLLDRMDDLRVPRRLAVADALVLAASSNPEAGRECLAFIAYCVETLHLPVLCGLSNISFGLPARGLLNASFLAMCAGAGLNACIADPSAAAVADAAAACNLLAGHDAGAENFLEHCSDRQDGPPARPAGGKPAKEASGSPSTLEEAVIAGRAETAEAFAHAAVEAGEDPFAVVRKRLIPAISEVGDRYERKEYFLPQLLRSAEAMQAAFRLLRPLLEKDSRAERQPVIVLATVEGDIHDIGKNIVALMLGNHGFDVVDLGKDVHAARIVEAAEAHDAPLIGLSALMTTTMVRMRDTVDMIRDKGLKQKVMVGGAVVTEDFAASIGAYYSDDAVGAVRLARSLLKV
jgi:5-methyltetrahydrofolate--homocysteine methyltransferase